MSGMAKEIKAEYNSVWDGGYIVSTECKINLDTGLVTPDIADESETEEVEILDREYIQFAGKDFDVSADAANDYRVVDIDGLRELVAQSIKPKPKASGPSF